MKAILCTRAGGPDDLVLRDIPDPAAGPGEAIVAVKAAALNFFDTLIIAGKYQTKPAFPFSPAAEFAGIVESLGAGVSGAHGRRPRHWVMPAMARRASASAAKADGLVKLPDGPRFRPRRRSLGHLWHDLSRAQGSRASASRRDAGRARRRRRHRPCRDRARQADGRARDRLRVVRRQARLRAPARRRRDGELRQGRSARGAAKRSAANAAST